MSEGSIVDPFHDLAEVFQTARVLPGQTIYLRGGTYTAIPTLAISGGAGSPITIRPYGNEEVIFQPSGGARALYIEHRAYLNIENIIFDGTAISSDVVKVTANSGGGSHDITFTNCTMRNGPAQGLLVTGDATNNISIIGCILHNNGASDQHHGVYMDIGGDGIIRGCECYGNSGHGIHVFGGPETGTWEVDHNICHDNGTGLGIYYGVGDCHDNQCPDNNVSLGVRYGLSGTDCYGNTGGLVVFGAFTTQPCVVDFYNNQFAATQVNIPSRLADNVTVNIHDNALGVLTLNVVDQYHLTLANNT